MSLEITLRELGSALISDRATERKKSAESLKTFLTGSAAPSILSENTLKKRGYGWNNLFEDVHEYILKEVEKSSTSKTYDSLIKPLATTLLHMVIAGSNKGQSYLKCDVLVNATLFILKSKPMFRAIGDAYLTLAHKYVFTQDFYVYHLSPQMWEDMLYATISACGSKDSKLDYFTRLRLVSTVMQRGTDSCRFTGPIRDSLARLQKHYLNPVFDKKVQEVLIDILNVVLKVLSVEYRYALCQFVEKILPSLLKFYDQNSDCKKKNELFKALVTVVELHHPDGSLRIKEGSYADDWDEWNKHLLNILELVVTECNVIERESASKFRQKMEIHRDCEYFYILAASVHYQYFSRVTNKENEDVGGESTTKRQRVSLSKTKGFDDLLVLMTEKYNPWLGIVYEYVKRYEIDHGDRMQLISVLDTCISRNKEKPCWSLAEKVLKTIYNRNVLLSDEEQASLNSIWSTCIRYGVTTQDINDNAHGILQHFMFNRVIEKNELQPLFKLYLEKAMPATNNNVKTLISLIRRDFNKFNTPERKDLFKWTIGENATIDSRQLSLLFFLLVSNENISIKNRNENSCASLHQILFGNFAQCLQFSLLQKDLDQTNEFHFMITPHQETELNNSVYEAIKEYFNSKLTIMKKDIAKFLKHCIESDILKYLQYLELVLDFCYVLIENTVITQVLVQESDWFGSTKSCLKIIFVILSHKLDNNGVQYIKVLRLVKDILARDYSAFIHGEIRSCIDSEFFKVLHKVINSKHSRSCEEDSTDADEVAPKHCCVLLLAAYCRTTTDFTKEIIEFILEPSLYEFTLNSDIECAFQCMEILTDDSVVQQPTDFIFTLLQSMCKELFRNPEATKRILKLLLLIIDKIWALECHTLKENCSIMVNVYLRRCEKMFYPPDVAALIYNCVSKVVSLSQNSKPDFRDAIVKATKGDTHALRLHSCYLVKDIGNEYTPDNIASFITDALDVFVINISNDSETIMKDELINRTCSFLHLMYAVAQTKNSLIKPIILSIIKVQVEKKLDRDLVLKVLYKISSLVGKYSFNSYKCIEVLDLIYFWYTSKYKTKDIPFFLIQYESLDSFLNKNVKWVIPGEVLWSADGNIDASEALKLYTKIADVNKEDIIEKCFSNILILCLPYIVAEKYNIEWSPKQKDTLYLRRVRSANKLFQATRDILGSDKWDKLFVENLSDIMLMSTLHLRDPRCQKVFCLDEVEPVEEFYYPEKTYLGLLKFYKEIIGCDILDYLCKHKPLSVSKILVNLWKQVLNKERIELSYFSMYAYIKFIENLPQGTAADTFVSNFACRSLLKQLNYTNDPKSLKMYFIALRILIGQFIMQRSDVLKEVLPQVISILMIKKEKSPVEECNVLLEYLLSHSDQTDGVLTNNIMKKTVSTTPQDFCATLKSYLSSLQYPCFEVLSNLKVFLNANKDWVIKLWSRLNLKGFSEECKISLFHNLINSLTNALTSNTSDKTKIEAANCLSIIGTYDLKTLVMSSPKDTRLIRELKPTQYFATKLLETLSKLLLNNDPNSVVFVVDAIKELLEYKDGKMALELGDVDQKLLKPFLPINSSYAQAVFSFDPPSCERALQKHFWQLRVMEKSSHWVDGKISTYVQELSDSKDNYMLPLLDICRKNGFACEEIFVSLIGLILYVSREEYIALIGEQINHFFDAIWNATFTKSNSQSSQCQYNFFASHDYKEVIQIVIKVVNFIRLQQKQYLKRSDEVESYNYLKLKYDKVAWAATFCGDHLAALYYGELWAAAQNKGVPPNAPEATMKLEGGENIQIIFRRCYMNIGEVDAIDGCGSGHLRDEDEKRKHLINSGHFSDALLAHDIAMAHAEPADNADLNMGVVEALFKSGMHHLALEYIKTLPENSKLKDMKYECLSMLGDWSVFVDTKKYNKPFDYHVRQTPVVIVSDVESDLKELRYVCLKDCLNLQPTVQDFNNKLNLSLSNAKSTISKLCEKLNMDDCQNVYNVVSNLHLFSDIEDYFAVRCSRNSMKELVHQWQVNRIAPFQDFKHVEALLSQRTLILEHAARTFKNFGKDVMNLQLSYAEYALSNKRVQLSQRLLALAKKCHSADEVSLVEGQIAWAKGHKEISLALVRDVMYNKNQDVNLTASAFRQYGTWMAESRCENARDIIDKYLMKSLEALGPNNRSDIRLKAYCDIAKYADAEYKQVVSYMKSSIFENKVKCMENMKGAASSMRSTQQSLSRDEKKAMITNERLSVIDEAEINSTITEKKRFLELAMRYYLLSLQQGETNNLAVFRIISLWLDNPNFEFEYASARFEESLQAVPSRKYVPVLPQLAPRLTNTNEQFAKKLNFIMVRCSKEHPFHTLPVLFGLKNSDKDKRIMNASAAVSSSKARTSSGGKEEVRVTVASGILAELAKENALATVIQQMDRMCDALISFANFESKTKDQRQPVPRSELIHKLGKLESVPIPTISVPLRVDSNYKEIPGIHSFAETFEFVGGINCPKKILCTGTDGIKRTMLIKGEDDLRQDAVMQQVFNIVNTLLDLDPVISKNRLTIRTYKVVALSRRSGVLEWCEGTVPLGLYLAGSSKEVGAHKKYRPKDISCNAARMKLTSCHEKGKSNAEKLATFLSILRDLRPVFHHFFTEHYLDPVSWYERRLAYTKSVATSSMIGYIMGLGDRHVQNILIDKKTAEVIHIDFGIAFDQGKALPTPETIPFRLSQDIIAGFGASGVEGVFRRCCEKTLQLLRDNHEALLTILEVLLYDPLYTWTITPAEAKRKQNLAATPREPNSSTTVTGGGGGGGGLAERALLAVASKLNGTEGGGAGGVAVAGQVARLVHCATDPANLSRLFPGWQPYL